MTEQPALYEVRVQDHIDRRISELGALYAYAGDHVYSALTTERLANGLKDFRLQFAHGVTIDWLVTALWRVLAMVTPAPDGMPDLLLSNVDKREKLRGLASRLKAVHEEIEGLDADTQSALFAGMDDESCANFEAGLIYLRLLEETVSVVAEGIVRDNPRWRDAAKRQMRIRQAWYLSPIYARAYGKEPTFNDRPNSQDAGPWPDFFRRVIALAEGEKVKDLRGVLKEARSRHTRNPVQYPGSFIANVR